MLKILLLSTLLWLDLTLFAVCCNRAIVHSKAFLNGLFEQPVIRGYSGSVQLNEISGIAASRRHTDVLYVLNDSGGQPRIFAINATTADLLATMYIRGAMNCDWEDITVGAGPHGQYIYIGDVGGNTHSRCNTIYRVREPLTIEDCQLEIHGEIRFDWEEGNCETLMVDEKGRIYLLAKVQPGNTATLYQVPNSARRFQKLELSNGTAVKITLETYGPTGGDISINGREILIRTYNYVYYWRRDVTTSLSTTLTRTPVQLPHIKDEPQSEAICWDNKGDGFFTISEGPSQPLVYYAKGPSREHMGHSH